MNLNKNQNELNVTDLEIFVLKYSENNHRSSNTDIYRRVFKNLKRVLGNKVLMDITPIDFEHYKSVRKDEVSKTTVNIEIRALRAIFNRANDLEFYSENPTKKLKQFCIPQKQIRCFKENEFLFLTSQIHDLKFKTLVQLAYLTGMRLSEIINLQWVDIDFEQEIIYVRNKENFTTKTGKIRDIPIPNKLMKILVEYRSTYYAGNIYGINDYVFANKNDLRHNKSYISRRFKNYVRKANLEEELHFHSLRHSYATNLANKGVGIHIISKLAGHSNIKTTEKYMHADLEACRVAVNQI